MFKRPITFLLTTTIVSLTSLITLIQKFEPCNSYSASNFCGTINSGSIILLQSNLFLFTLSLFTLILYLVKILKSNASSNKIKNSFRQSFLISVLIQFTLTTTIFDILYLWNLLIVTGILLTIEMISKS